MDKVAIMVDGGFFGRPLQGSKVESAHVGAHIVRPRLTEYRPL
jgi:hypothetical protein